MLKFKKTSDNCYYRKDVINIGKVIISMGSSTGIYSDDLTATCGDVLKGATYVGADTDDDIGVGTLELTGNAAEAYVLQEKSFYSTDPKTKQSGTMPNRNDINSTLGGINQSYPTVAVHKGTNPQVGTTVTSKETLFSMQPPYGYYNGSYVGMLQTDVAKAIGLNSTILANNNTVLGVTGTYKGLGNATTDQVLSGSKFSTASLSNATGTMTNNGAVNKSLDPGGSYTIAKGYHNGTGKVTAKSKVVKQLGVTAMRGFNSDFYDPGPYEESFTMPANGTVYYEGISASYAARATVICEIYKNGTVVDSRNIDGSNDYTFRSTMLKQSFSASSGDVIKVKASVTGGTHQMSAIYATIVYFA